MHASRNPRIVRVLTELGYMRELGEGIPRMFEVMEREGLNPPKLDLEGGCFVVTLYSEPIYPPETLRWLRQFDHLGLSRNQKRLLAYAHTHGGRFTSRAYQKLVGVDLYTASKDIKDLLRKGIARLVKRGGRVYEILAPQPKIEITIPKEFRPLEGVLKQQGYLRNEDVREVLKVSRIQAYRLLQRWVEQGIVEPQGKGRGTRYILRRAKNASVSRGNASLKNEL